MTTEQSRVHLRATMPETSRAQYAVTDTILGRAAEVGVSRAVLELAFVRVSQINRCAYCVDVHTGLAERFYREDGTDDATVTRKLAMAPAWREAAGSYTEAEQGALEIAEYATLPASETMPDATYERLRTLFGDDALAVLLMGCINMNVFNRIHLLSKTPIGEK